MRGSRMWFGGALALILASQTGCIVSVLVREFLAEEEECASGEWRFEHSQSYASQDACEEQASATHTCVCVVLEPTSDAR